MTFSLLSDEYKSGDVWGLIDSKAHLWKFFSKENTFIKNNDGLQTNDTNRNMVPGGQMVLERTERKTEVVIYHIPLLCSQVSIETSQTHVNRVSGHLSGLYICCGEEWEFSEVGKQKRVISNDTWRCNSEGSQIVKYPQAF